MVTSRRHYLQRVRGYVQFGLLRHRRLRWYENVRRMLRIRGAHESSPRRHGCRNQVRARRGGSDRQRAAQQQRIVRECERLG